MPWGIELGQGHSVYQLRKRVISISRKRPFAEYELIEPFAQGLRSCVAGCGERQFQLFVSLFGVLRPKML